MRSDARKRLDESIDRLEAATQRHPAGNQLPGADDGAVRRIAADLTLSDEASEIATLLNDHAYVPSGLRGVSRCACGLKCNGMPHEWRNHVAALLAARSAQHNDRADAAEAEASNYSADYDRRGERLWRLAALAGHVPCESDNDATAELAITDALAARRPADEDGLRALAKRAIDAIGTGGHSHWREGGAGGCCGACDRATKVQAEFRAEYDRLARHPAEPGAQEADDA